MNNEPVAWININVDVFNGKPTLSFDKDEFAEITKPLYTHPHPDNLGFAESIIKQQEIQIEALKAEVKQWEEWKESLNGWSKK